MEMVKALEFSQSYNVIFVNCCVNRIQEITLEIEHAFISIILLRKNKE